MKELKIQLECERDPLKIIEICDKILDKRFVRYINSLFLKAEILMSLERLDEAITIFKQILEYGDKRFFGRAYNSIGFCYLMSDEVDFALSHFKKASKYLDKESLFINSAILNLSAIYSTSNQKEKLFKIFKDLHEFEAPGGDDVSKLWLVGINDSQEFIDYYKRSFNESYLIDVNVMFEKANALTSLERYDEAIDVFEEILKYSNDKKVCGSVHGHLGIIYSKTNHLDKAVFEFEKYCKNSDDETALFYLASAYLMTNQKEKSLKIFKQFDERFKSSNGVRETIEKLEVEINSKNLFKDTDFDSADDAVSTMNNYLKGDEFEKALKVCDLLVEIMSKEATVWNLKGFACYKADNFEDALNCFDKALECEEDNFYSNFYKSLVYMKLNDYKNAYKMMIEVLIILPDRYKFLKAYFNFLFEIDAADEAIIINIAARSSNKNEVEAFTKSFEVANSDNFDEAINYYKNALKESSKTIQILTNIALIYAIKGDFEESYKYLDRVIGLCSDLRDSE